MMNFLRLALLLVFGTWVCYAQGTPSEGSGFDYFTNLPPSDCPKVVGDRLIRLFLDHPFEFETHPKREVLIYPEYLTEFGALKVAKEAGDLPLQNALINKFNRFWVSPDTNRVSMKDHVDYRAFGVVPLEIYLETWKPSCLQLGLRFADSQWASTSPDGITAEARYWIDDTYMITALQVQAYRATHQAQYLDRASRTLSLYIERLQQSDGLFWHGTNAPFEWGRGNGWVAAAMTELLLAMPQNHEGQEKIMSAYQRMMAALVARQRPDGLWGQLLDQPSSWAETSGSAMFDYALVTGVRSGWLNCSTYGPPARKGWLALVKELDPDGNLKDVCTGTDKGSTRDYYLQRPRETGNLHGQAPMLWTAAALLRPDAGIQSADSR